MSEGQSPKAIIAESILENFEAVHSYVARQSLRDMLDENQTLRDERDRLRFTIRTLCSSGNRLLDDLIGRSEAAELFKYHVKQAQAALTPARGREEVTMILVQWFFTVWVGGVPHEVGPFVNETQCENMVQTYMDGGPFGGYVPPYRPVCTKKEFELKVRP